MIKGLGWVSIWSQDLNNLLPFYRDVLGLAVTTQSDGFVTLGDGKGGALGLGTHSEVKGKAGDPYRHMVGLESDDLEAEVSRLEAAGVEFIEKPTDYGGGMKIATIRDPEGNIVQLSQVAG